MKAVEEGVGSGADATVSDGNSSAKSPSKGLPSRLCGRSGVAYRALLGSSLVALAYLVFLTMYLIFGSNEVLDLSRAVYPFVWLTTVGGAFATVGHLVRRISAFETVIAGGYIILLTWISGGLSVGWTELGITTSGGIPGWGPVIGIDAFVITVVAVPFQVIGYVTLGFLIAQALQNRSGSAAAGVIGLLSCAGCILPLLAVSASIGMVPAFSGSIPYSVSTIAFVLSTTLLVGVVVRHSARDVCAVNL
ncbi:hypothetical protein JCM17823_06480 [Halorubrum gandharaense]